MMEILVVEDMKNRLIRIIKCPKCNSENFRLHGIDEHKMYDGICWGLYSCEDCGTDFEVEYIANDICLTDPEY